MKQFRYILIALCILLIVGIACYYTGKNRGINESYKEPSVKVDTLFIYDTIVSEIPIYVTKTKVERVMVPVIDTLRVTDTLFIYLDREQIVWQDSLSRIYASGIDPQVDSVHHFIRERVITREVTIPQVKVKKTRWGLGFQAGYGVGIHDKKVMGSPYVGVGVSYNLISW